MNNVAINRLADRSARNLIRGLLARDITEKVAVATLNKLRTSQGASSARLVAEILVSNPLFSHLPLPDAFPPTPTTADRMVRLGPQSLRNELVFQCVRMAHESEKLSEAFSALADLNRDMLTRPEGEVIAAFESFRSRYGESLVVLRKVAFASSTSPPECTSIRDYSQSVFSAYGATQRNIITLANVDVVDDSYDFIPLRRSMLEFVREGGPRDFETTIDIVEHVYRPFGVGKNRAQSTLHSYGLISLLDTAHFVLANMIGGRCLSGVASVVRAIVPECVFAAWERLQTSVLPAETAVTKPDDLTYTDFAFYRRSLAWLELPEIANFRESVDPYFVDGREVMRAIGMNERAASNAYFSTLGGLSSIACEAGFAIPALTKYDNEGAGMFVRTVALARLIKNGASASALTEAELLTLVSSTVDVPLLVSPGELEQFFSDRQHTPVTDYIAAAMISDCTGKQSDDHAFRKALQKLVITRFERDIVRCAEFFRHVSNAVALHLFNKADTAFLILLFDLYPRTDMVIEARALLLEWYAQRYDDVTATDRARTLRVDQRLQQVRGEIDDLRIYADPLRFSQWLQDNTVEDLSAVLRPGAITDAQIATLREIGNFAEQREPVNRLASVLQKSFGEFCSSRRYGVDSYIGRRIRHGTLAGSMVSGLRAIFGKAEYAPLLSTVGLGEHLQEWRQAYERHVDRLASDFFHIRSKQKPLGLIDTGVFASHRIDILRQSMRDIVFNATSQPNIATTHSLIVEYCWRMLEPDLKRIRAFVSESRQEWGILDRQTLQKFRPGEHRQLLSDLCREVNLFTDSRFQSVSKWFTKPVTVAPAASFSLLFDAVLAEVKERFPNFAPTIIQLGSFDDQLVGGAYHHIYDFFFIVIANAAEHGEATGTLSVSISTERDETTVRIVIQVTSDIKAADSTVYVSERLDAAKEGSLDDAMVVAGGSGLRKLARLEMDSREIDRISVGCQERRVVVSCELKVANAG